VTFAEYQTPAGYRDTPFIYVYDPNTLRNLFPFVADGNDQLVCTQPVTNQSVRLLYGEQFILRRVNPSFLSIGPQLVSDPPGGLKLRDALNRDRFSDPRPLTATSFDITGYPMNCDLPMAPEMAWPVNSQMLFSLYGIKLRFNQQVPATDPNTVPLSQLLFQGVRRFLNPAPDNRPLQKGWEERYYVYPLPITIDWPYWQGGLAANGQSEPKRFYVNVQNWDFELLEIRSYFNFSPVICSGFAAPECARVVLYDWSLTALMNAPVNLNAINSVLNMSPTGGLYAPGVFAGSGALCPSIIYPNRSNIAVDVYSMLNRNNVASHTILMLFIGRRRWAT
jgi:hypothetical protein